MLYWKHMLHLPKIQGEFTWMFFIPALVFFGLLSWFMYKNLRIIVSSTRTHGTIVGFDSIPSREINGKSTDGQRVQFLDAHGRSHEAVAEVRSNPPSGNVGDRITIYYNPTNPDEAHIGSFMEMWLHIVIFGFLFWVFFTIWFGVLVGPKGQVHG